MKNPNSPIKRLQVYLKARWSSEDYPGAEARFQLTLLGKDVLVFFLLPIFSIIFYKSCENASFSTGDSKKTQKKEQSNVNGNSNSQIISFVHKVTQGAYSTFIKKSPGSLVKVRLMNVVETYANVPVHAQIVDTGLGRKLMGGTIIGDAIANTNFERININFRFVRDPKNDSIAIPISARALGLDGTLGLIAEKKEGFLARSAIGSAENTTQSLQGKGNSVEFKDVLIKALTAGLIQEFGTSTSIEKNRSNVLTLKPNTEFLVELTDFFPGSSR